MGKRHFHGKSSTYLQSIKQTPSSLQDPEQRLNYREVRRRSIIAGLRMMKAPAVVAVLVNMIFACQTLQFSRANELDHVELFAGDCSVTRGELTEGRRAMAVDVVIGGSTMDLTSDAGFVGALYHTCRLSPGSGWLAAPVCSSFVYMSRGTTKRSPTRPLGEESYPSVALGNLLLCRTLVILCIAHALRCFWLLEQPKGSLMEAHPLFEEVMRMIDVWKHCIQMKNFGAPSAKPTWLYSSHSDVERLMEFAPSWVPPAPEVEMAVKYIDRRGKQRVKGGKHLKGSQSYPVPFGRSLSQLRSTLASRLRKDARATVKQNLKGYLKVKRNTRADARWIKHANLGPIFEFLA